MRDFQSVKISSKFTNASYVGGIILLLIFPIVTLAGIMMADTIIDAIIILVIDLILLVVSGYTLLYLSKAKIINNQFYLKKLFRPEKQYPLSALVALDVYDWGSTTYILFTMDEDGHKEKYMVYIARDIIYGGERINSEEILKEILSENLKR